jgi:hypothetical protein
MPSSRRNSVDALGKRGRIDTRSAADPTRETPDTLGTLQRDATKKFEAVAFDQVAGGPGNAHAGHGGHGTNTGTVDAGFAKESRGIKDASGLFAAQKGHSPKRGPGTKTPTDMATRRKLSEAEGG